MDTLEAVGYFEEGVSNVVMGAEQMFKSNL